MTAELEVKNLTVEYGRRYRLTGGFVLRAVDDVSLTVETGETLAIVGESGSGKTTLAKTIAGFVAPKTGDMRFCGAELPAVRDRATRRQIQMIFQDPGLSLNPSLSVRRMLSELMRFHAMVDADGIDARCNELIQSVGLNPSFLPRHPRQLSGGQRQRVAIARALAVKPRLLIADEAVAALDYSVRSGVLNLLADLKNELGMTTIFISHDLGIVERIADRVIVMNRACIIEDRPTADLFREPRNDYTRSLLAAIPEPLPVGSAPGGDELRR